MRSTTRPQETVWVQGQRQITSSTSSSILAKARNSGHAIAEERPGLVSYALKLVVKSVRKQRAATHVPRDPCPSSAGPASN